MLCLLMAGLNGLAVHAGQAPQPQRAGIGYVYPAGGQQGTTFQVTLGGQHLEGVNAAFVSGGGVQAKIVDLKALSFSKETLLREQRDELRESKDKDQRAQHKQLIAAIEKKVNSFQRNPASVAIGQQVVVEVTIAPDAQTGPREIRLSAQRGLSNPLDFHVGHLPEYSMPPAAVSPKQILGREEESLRTRKLHDEIAVKLPCVVNGQISSGAIDRYRFQARKGQKLVFSAMAKQLVPYIADAVPGWFQAVLRLTDGGGQEVAFSDDYKFKPDPVILYEVEKDGEYTLSIHDSIYRGREDFVYRIVMGEVPFVTSLFPLGGTAGGKTEVELKGWNLPFGSMTLDLSNAPPGIRPVCTRVGSSISNGLPFMADVLPERTEQEPNSKPAEAQKVALPIVINGRIDRPDDWDVFRFEGRAGETVVAEVFARRLDSPLDSVLKLTDAAGQPLAANDDHEDKSAGLNTHDADSYLTVTLPADGTYFVHLGDTGHKGGEDHAYRLRIGPPQPDFALRVVPASVGIQHRGAVPLTVFVFRKDGFDGDIQLDLADPPKGFSLAPATLSRKDESVQVTLKTAEIGPLKAPISLHLVGRSTIGGKERVREAVPAEDRMQAFFYRHLVPATELQAFAFTPPPAPELPPSLAAIAAQPPPKGAAKSGEQAPKRMNKDQIIRTFRDLTELQAEGLLTREFFERKIRELESPATPTVAGTTTPPAPATGTPPAAPPTAKSPTPASGSVPAATATNQEPPRLPRSGPPVKKVFVLKDGRTIRAVMIADAETTYVLKDVEMKIHEVNKDDVVSIKDP